MPRLAVDDDGPSDAPAVVLLHGLTATRRYVVMGSKALERGGLRVVAYDARGHGESEPADRYGYEELCSDLLAVLDERGIERAILAGASMGAHTIVRFALERPERVAAACLITPAYLPDRHGEDLEAWDRLAAGLREGGVEGFIAAYDTSRLAEGWRETVTTVLRQRLGRHRDLAAVADAVEQVPRSRPFADIAQLSALRAPTIVVADRDEADPGHPLAVGEAYARAIPGARLVVEEQGRSPIAWQGAQLSRLIGSLA